MRNFRFLPIFICVALFLAILSFSWISKPVISSATIDQIVKSNNIEAEPVINLNTEIENTELRGVWITYMDLALEDGKRSEKDFTEKFRKMAENCKNSGFNTLIVQVRPFNDALYKSELFPTSHIIAGVQGEKLNYDPLKIMCDICNELDLSIHAWVNPYRVSLNETPAKLSDDNPYIKNEELGVETNNGIYLNPALIEVRDLIVKGVCEIIENYDVDGIQFDDYFYPTTDESFDKEQYEEYCNTHTEPMSLQEWRMNNVNILIGRCYLALHRINNDIEFGISPQGNIDNNDALGADIKTWCKDAGYIDYICPQIYFSLDNPALTFEDAVNSWIDLEYSGYCDIYIGLAGYKAGTDDSDEGTWKDKDDILKKEIEYIRKYSQIKGFMLYSYDCLEQDVAKQEIENVMSILN